MVVMSNVVAVNACKDLRRPALRLKCGGVISPPVIYVREKSSDATVTLGKLISGEGFAEGLAGAGKVVRRVDAGTGVAALTYIFPEPL